MTSNPLTQTPLTFRHDFCALNDQVQVYKNLTLEEALQGIDLNIVIMQGDFVRFKVEQDSETGEVLRRWLDPDFPGLVPRLLDNLCERAGCSWRNTYSAPSYSELGDEDTFLDLLLWSTDTYDLMAEWWMRSIERLKAGATFTEPWYDGTVIMVAPKPKPEKDEFDAWGFMNPFETSVWVMVMATMIASAIIHAFLRLLDPLRDSDEENEWTELLWKYATAFAGQFEFEPNTGPQRLFTFSIAFWALLMTSAYTANLASFLVIRNTPEVQVNSVQQAVDMGLKLCLWRSSQTDITISSAFPTFAATGKLIRTASSKGVFEALQEGLCDIAITEVSTWDVFQNDADANVDCSLTWIGRPFQTIPASFAVKGDAGTLCTSLLRDVFNLYLHNMEVDGTIQQLWDEHIQQQSTVTCSEDGTEVDATRRRRRLQKKQEEYIEANPGRRLKTASSAAAEAGSGDEGEGQLTLTNMGGVFLLHGILSAVSLLCALVDWFFRRGSDDHDDVSHPDDMKKLRQEKSGTNDDEASTNSLYYFDAEGGPKEGSIAALRSEMTTRLASIEEKLAALLEK